MAKRLIQLKIEHIAGVDKPANKRKFLVVKKEKEEPTEKKEGNAMLTKEQLAKLMGLTKSDEDLSKAIVDQQEELVTIGKKVAELEASMKSGGIKGSDDVFKNEKLWEGVSPVLRNRMEEVLKERDKAAEDARIEKERREEEHWTRKSQKLKYAQTSDVAFGIIMRKVAGHCPDEAEEIFRILERQDDLIGKGALFQTIGKTHGVVETGGDRDPTNPTARVEAMARDFRLIDPKLTYEESVNKVFSERPDLYKAYTKQTQIRVGN